MSRPLIFISYSHRDEYWKDRILLSYAGMCARQQPNRATEMIERHALYFGAEIGGSYQRAINDKKAEVQYRALERIDEESDNILPAQIRAIEEEFTNHELAVEITDE